MKSSSSHRTHGLAALVFWLLLGIITLTVGGCGGNEVQSMLRADGPAAREIQRLWWILFGLGSAVFLLVLVLLGAALFRPASEDGPPLGESRYLLVFGILFPFAILFIVLVLSLRSTLGIRTPDADLTVEVVGNQFWWDVRYPADSIEVANEIYIPAGRPVHLRLSSRDVIHSFWVPALHGKMDLIPGMVNHFWIEADSIGLFRGQCAEFCGDQHANMALWVHALDPDEFDRWRERRRRAETLPETTPQDRGYTVFVENGCDTCHRIAGTPADGAAGPALTDIGSRLTLGAGTIYNSRTNLANFIINSQAIKPGNEMPDQRIGPDDLEALLDYLQSLR
ncbi:MAG: cytochrome c oxidase subunit II [Bacteroidota bacterium]